MTNTHFVHISSMKLSMLKQIALKYIKHKILLTQWEIERNKIGLGDFKVSLSI